MTPHPSSSNNKEIDEILETAGIKFTAAGTDKWFDKAKSEAKQALLDWVLAEVVGSDQAVLSPHPEADPGSADYDIAIENDLRATQRQIIQDKKESL